VTTTDTQLLPIPAGLEAVGTRDAPFEMVATLTEVAAGEMLRVTRGDLDLVVANTPAGLCVIDDRCPHMAAPLSLGTLEDCVVGCPLHRGKFDLTTGDVVQFPTTGGLDADGEYHPTWTPSESAPKAEPADLKARARALTRVRRLRYYPARIVEGAIEVRLPR
jgi:nitrite reductase/ring-hydroxylating ferredoxin subunit